MVEFTIDEVIQAVQGSLEQGGRNFTVRGISTDSRKIMPDELFVALKGENFDGHQFVDTVAQAGAKAVVVMQPVAAPADLTVIRVENTLDAFGALARAHRRRFVVPVIAVTGSNGKTTTKDLVASVLEQSGAVVKTEKNFNNEIGLPLTLFKMSENTHMTVVEMGMRGLGQICHLAGIAEPTAAIVTNVGLSHLELLHTQQNIAKAKAELVEALRPDGLAILNGDDPLVRAMHSQTSARTVLYGIETLPLDYQATQIAMTEAGSNFTVQMPDGCMTITLPLPGRHNILNALSAIAAAKEYGLSNAMIQAGLRAPEMTGKRLHIVEHQGCRIIDDTYNASPTSIQAALDVLMTMQSDGKKIAVLADMLELGPQTAQIHRELGETAAKMGVYRLFAYGDLAREYVNGFNAVNGQGGAHFTSKEELTVRLKQELRPGDQVLVKGSRDMKMEDIVASLTLEGE